MATWLGAHGPPFVRLLAHGVLVELVQLLLNRKVLLFRKGRVSVASRSEASEAASLGLLFSATDFSTPAVSRLVSPAVSRPTSPALLPGLEAGIWKEDVSGANQREEEASWRAAPPPTNGATTGRPLFSSYSLPGTRASSPVRLRSPPGMSGANGQAGSGDLRSTRPVMPKMLEKRKSISSLEPLKPEVRMPPARSIFESAHMIVGAAGTNTGAPTFEHGSIGVRQPLNGNAKEFEAGKNIWVKDPEAAGTTGSAAGSAYASRRNSMSDMDGWRSAITAGAAAGLPATFESSSGFAGESMDACDPAAVLAVKLARLNSDHIAQSTATSDELARFTAAVQYRPCFHFEKSGAAHTPEWICLVAFSIGPKRYQMRSKVQAKKDQAKNEVCMKVLQMIEDESIAMAPHAEAAGAIDSVVDLARLLNFLQQAPVVYYLTRAPPNAGAAGLSGAARFDQRGASNMISRRHSISGPAAGHHAYGIGAQLPMWNGSTRIQVKSVNILTGEAQPTVSASTPFTHSVTCASKNEAKEQIAANLLSQIQRARVVNPSLFSVLSAARQNITAVPAHPQSLPSTTSTSTADAMMWSNSLAVPASVQAPISAPGGGVPPPVDIHASGHESSASLFSMHTPVPGRPYSGISAIGLATPMATPMATPGGGSAPDTPAHSDKHGQAHHTYSSLTQVVEAISPSSDSHSPVEDVTALSKRFAAEMPRLSRTASEAQNAAAQATSTASAESALED